MPASTERHTEGVFRQLVWFQCCQCEARAGTAQVREGSRSQQRNGSKDVQLQTPTKQPRTMQDSGKRSRVDVAILVTSKNIILI